MAAMTAVAWLDVAAAVAWLDVAAEMACPARMPELRRLYDGP